jgi:hypothetical protein
MSGETAPSRSLLDTANPAGFAELEQLLTVVPVMLLPA